MAVQWVKAIPRRLVWAALSPVILIIVGTFGYWLIEDWPLFDSLYMTVITLTTVGYLEVREMGVAGRTFTMVLALGGVFVLFYMASEIIRSLISGEVQAALGRHFMEINLTGLRNHMIVCGYGRMGRHVCQVFSAGQLPFVIIERQPANLEGFKMPHGLALSGDATSDDVLKHAGVERARALVAVVGSDADNLYITMSARLLNDNLLIVARADDERSESKLLRAGADRVISPHILGGYVVAQAVLRPNVLDFLNLATRSAHLELQIEEAQLAEGSSLVGVPIKDGRFRKDLGLIIVAIKKPTGQMLFNPPPETTLAAGDILIVLGDRPHLDAFEKLARG